MNAELASFLPATFEWWHIPLLFLAGFIGESFGAIVGGGSIVTLPALLLTGIPLQAAIANDNASSIGTSTGILSETYKKVIARKKLVALMAIPITLGGVIGTYLLLTVPAEIIRYLMVAAVIAMIVDAHFARKPNPRKISTLRYEVVFVFLLFMGVYSNFMSAGDGTFSRMGLMFILGMSFIQSQGITAAAALPSRIYSLVITSLAGLIIWPYLLTMWCSTFFAGKYATRFAKHVPDKSMRVALTVVSLIFVTYLLFFYGR